MKYCRNCRSQNRKSCWMCEGAGKGRAVGVQSYMSLSCIKQTSKAVTDRARQQRKAWKRSLKKRKSVLCRLGLLGFRKCMYTSVASARFPRPPNSGQTQLENIPFLEELLGLPQIPYISNSGTRALCRYPSVTKMKMAKNILCSDTTAQSNTCTFEKQDNL